jgi:hypothetical protein
MRFKNVLTISIIAFAGTLAAACGDNIGPSAGTGDDVDASTGGPADAEDSADAVPNHPPNPDGLGPARVEIGPIDDLTQAGAYVLIGKTGITNVTGSMITGGHLGISPAPAGALTGFGETLDSSGLFSTAPAVVAPGRIYTTGNTAPTPANLTSAVLSMQAAYTDAAGRTNPDELNLADGVLANLDLAPGLYRWGSNVSIPQNITLTGSANDVWIFQISGELVLGTAKQILLAGGADAKNIFWVVAGQVTIHADAHFEGIIFGQTGITLQTNASWNGRALAQSLVALDDNHITAP